MNRVFIAEKPSLARAIAAGLGNPKKEDGYIQCGQNDVVTWCFGHLLELAEPGEYDEKFKRWAADTLPIIPSEFRKIAKADKGVSAQISIIKKLLKGASSAVNAGDPDREGQLLVDEVLELLGWSGPTSRIWLAATDPQSVKKALANLKDNAEFRPLRDAAETRSRADWLVGLNLTRACTIAARKSGAEGVYSVGRVQTPTLALIVRRDAEIESFKPRDFYVPTLTAKHRAGDFTATWQAPDDAAGLDPEGRLVDRAAADAVAARCAAGPATVASYSSKAGSAAAPLPYSLSALQKAAGGRYKMTAAGVLKAAQSLYEKGVTSYPRSDCRYLPEEQHGQAGDILQAAALVVPGAHKADSAAKHSTWNTKKVTAHHAIIPTGRAAASLSDDERQVYALIAASYVRLFLPAQQYEQRQAVLAIGEDEFRATARVVTAAGWTDLGGEESDDDEDEDEEPAASLPPLTEGEALEVAGVAAVARQTKAPARWTDGSLISAMSSIHRFVGDSKAKARLRETSGIGTEATRANILETLVGRAYVARKKGQLVSTAKGRDLVAKVPAALSDPATTAVWEDALASIESGKMDMETFLGHQTGVLPKMVQRALAATFDAGPIANPCPTCKGPLRRLKGKSSGKHFWACQDRSHPLLSDAKGKPGQPFAKDKKAA